MLLCRGRVSGRKGRRWLKRASRPVLEGLFCVCGGRGLVRRLQKSECGCAESVRAGPRTRGRGRTGASSGTPSASVLCSGLRGSGGALAIVLVPARAKASECKSRRAKGRRQSCTASLSLSPQDSSRLRQLHEHRRGDSIHTSRSGPRAIVALLCPSSQPFLLPRLARRRTTQVRVRLAQQV